MKNPSPAYILAVVFGLAPPSSDWMAWGSYWACAVSVRAQTPYWCLVDCKAYCRKEGGFPTGISCWIIQELKLEGWSFCHTPSPPFFIDLLHHAVLQFRLGFTAELWEPEPAKAASPAVFKPPFFIQNAVFRLHYLLRVNVIVLARQQTADDQLHVIIESSDERFPSDFNERFRRG